MGQHGPGVLPPGLRTLGPSGGATNATRLAWFRRVLLVHVAARTLLTEPGWVVGEYGALLRWATVGVALAGVLAPHGGALKCTRIACPLVLVSALSAFPDNANHVFLEFVLLAFLAFLDERDEREGVLLCAALRGTVAIVLVWSGLQKVIHGTYFDGQFLAYMAATKTWFTEVFQHVVPDAELHRLTAFNERLDGSTWQPAVGAGPYRVDSVLFVALSNAVYVLEIAVGLLLLLPRTRAAAALAGIAMVVFIELGAREIVFGILIVNALALSLRGDAPRRMFPYWTAVYAYLVLAARELVPMVPYASS